MLPMFGVGNTGLVIEIHLASCFDVEPEFAGARYLANTSL